MFEAYKNSNVQAMAVQPTRRFCCCLPLPPPPLGRSILELPAWDCRAMGADQAAAAHPARNLPPRAHCLGVCRTHFDMLRRGASRLLPRLLGTGSQAAVALQKGEAALLPRLAAAAAPADAAAALRSFRSSTAAYSSSLAESLRWVRLPDRTKKAPLQPPPPLPPLPAARLTAAAVFPNSLRRNELEYEKQNYEQAEVSCLHTAAVPVVLSSCLAVAVLSAPKAMAPPTRPAAPRPAQELAAGPPAGFTLTESKGDTLMSLSKDYRGEKVAVDVMVNDQVSWLLTACTVLHQCSWAASLAQLHG